MKLVTKEHERRLNRGPLYEKRYSRALKKDIERVERLVAKAQSLDKLIAGVDHNGPDGVPPNYLEVVGFRSAHTELVDVSYLLAKVELKQIELEAITNAYDVMLDITARFIQEVLIKPDLPRQVDSMREQIGRVRRDLNVEMKVAKKAKRWLLRAETHRPKTGNDGLDEMFP